MRQATDADGSFPVILYRARCPRCRFLSRLLVAISLGMLRRIPVDSAAAHEIYDRYGIERGKLALLYRQRLRTGRFIVLSLWLALVDSGLNRVFQGLMSCLALGGVGERVRPR
jgi:hypothetical protein